MIMQSWGSEKVVIGFDYEGEQAKYNGTDSYHIGTTRAWIDNWQKKKNLEILTYSKSIETDKLEESIKSEGFNDYMAFVVDPAIFKKTI